MRLIFCLLSLSFIVFNSCKNEKKSVDPLVVTMTTASSKNCVRDTVCAEMSLTYPVLSGGPNPKAVQAINDSLLSFVYMVIGGNPALPLPQAFDSASVNLYSMLVEQLEAMPDFPMGFTNELKSKVVFQNERLISLELNNYSFTGGAHGNYGTALSSFLLSTGQSVPLTDIVKDTAALRPLLEKGFVDAKMIDGEKLKLEELVFPESLPLPLPLQWCITAEGLRLIYNPYEVAPYAVGLTDILLKWDDLGALADRKKWLE